VKISRPVANNSDNQHQAVQQQPVNPAQTKLKTQQYQNETQTDARKQ